MLTKVNLVPPVFAQSMLNEHVYYNTRPVEVAFEIEAKVGGKTVPMILAMIHMDRGVPCQTYTVVRDANTHPELNELVLNVYFAHSQTGASLDVNERIQLDRSAPGSAEYPAHTRSVASQEAITAWLE